MANRMRPPLARARRRIDVSDRLTDPSAQEGLMSLMARRPGEPIVGTGGRILVGKGSAIMIGVSPSLLLIPRLSSCPFAKAAGAISASRLLGVRHWAIRWPLGRLFVYD